MRPPSKFKHVFGQSTRKDACYENLRVTTSAHDGNICAVNPRFIAVASEAGGGAAFLVLPLKKVGRIEASAPCVFGHCGAVNELKWSPFDDFTIASCSDDCTVKIWKIPEYGLATNLTRWIADLQGHARRVTYIEWHPSAENILLSAGFDYRCIVWNVKTCQAASIILCHENTIHSLSWNRDGSLFATSCKDKKIRVIDPRRRCVVHEGAGHDGLKPSKVTFVTGSLLLTTGFSKRGDREIALWDSHDMSRPVSLDIIDYSSGVLLPFYDPDTQVVYVAGKGDGNIRYYEVHDDPPHLRYLSQYPSADPQRALGWMPKRGLDTAKCEVARFYKLHSEKSLIEPLPMIVPRRSSEFAEDVYPPTASYKPALTADEWLSGVNRAPMLIPLKEAFAEQQPAKAVGSPARRSALSKDGKVAFERLPESPRAPVVQLPAKAPASLRNILKLSTDPSHVVAAQPQPTVSAAAVVPCPTAAHGSSTAETAVAAETATVDLADSELVLQPVSSAQVSAGEADVRPFTRTSHASSCAPQNSKQGAAAGARDMSTAVSSRTELAEGEAPSGNAISSLPFAPSRSGRDGVETDAACHGDSRRDSVVVPAACSTPSSPNVGADEPASLTSLSTQKEAGTTQSVMIDNAVAPLLPVTDAHRDLASPPSDAANRSQDGHLPTAPSTQSQQQQQLRSRPKTWRDASAWQQPALPVQPPEDELPAMFPRRLQSGRLVQPQFSGRPSSLDQRHGSNTSELQSPGVPIKAISVPREGSENSLSNDELHKTYFKQVDEIKSLRQQVSTREKKIAELEVELDQMRKRIAELEEAATADGSSAATADGSSAAAGSSSAAAGSLSTAAGNSSAAAGSPSAATMVGLTRCSHS